MTRPPLKFLLVVVALMVFNAAFSLQFLIFTNIPAPLELMFNESFHDHYGSFLDTFGISTIWSISSFSQRFGELIGIALLFLIDRKGRKFAAVYLRFLMMISSGVLLILSYLLPSCECFTVACAINGAGLQIKIAAVGIYLSECAPTRFRGFATIMIAFGEILGSVCALTLFRPSFFGNEDSWFMFPVISIILSSLVMLFLFWIPESPQFLLNKGRYYEAERAIEFYNGKEVDSEYLLSTTLKHTKGALDNGKLGYGKVIKDETLRKTLILLIVNMLFMDVSASSVELMFYAKIHSMLGFEAETIMTIGTLQRLVMIPFFFFSSIAIEKIGRRPIALTCYFLLYLKAATMLFGLSLSFFSGTSLITQIAAVISDIFSSAYGFLGIGQMQTLFLCELTPPSSRIAMVQLTAGISMAVGIVFAALIPYAFSYFPPSPYILFIVFQPFLIYYIYRNLPETAGRELYEITEDFDEAVRSRAPTRRTTVVFEEERTPLL